MPAVTGPTTGAKPLRRALVGELLLLATSGGSATYPITTALPLTADIIGGIRVERRIEIDQVNALGRDAIAENL